MQIRDVAFLHRYSEPVLLVLHEARPTWAGMLREAKDTLEATALSVNVLHRRVTRLWSVPNLPSDAAAVLAVPRGGALVICRSLLIYVSQVCCKLFRHCSWLALRACSACQVAGIVQAALTCSTNLVNPLTSSMSGLHQCCGWTRRRVLSRCASIRACSLVDWLLWCAKGGSCSLAVASQAYAGVTPAKLDMSSYTMPSVLAVKHAQQYATNVHPVGIPPTFCPSHEG